MYRLEFLSVSLSGKSTLSRDHGSFKAINRKRMKKNGKTVRKYLPKPLPWAKHADYIDSQSF